MATLPFPFPLPLAHTSHYALCLLTLLSPATFDEHFEDFGGYLMPATVLPICLGICLPCLAICCADTLLLYLLWLARVVAVVVEQQWSNIIHSRAG